MSELKSDEVVRQFNQLAELEREFDKVDVEILRETTIKQSPLYDKRNAITSAISGFWPHVFEDASSSLGFDEHITPEDAEVLAHLTELNVTRPNAEKGDPRDIEFRFTFKDNDYMPAQTVTKLFTYQDGRPGSPGLISTPTKIEWKDTKDLTFGVNKAAIEAFEERKAKAQDKKAKLGGKEQELLRLLNKNSQSFFTWFSYTGSHRDLNEDDDDIEDLDDEDEGGITRPVDPFPFGDELAIQLAEDVFPHAVKYFTSSLEETDDEDDADIDLDSDDGELPIKHSHSHNGGSCGSKHKHSHSHSESPDEPAKKKVKK